mmetsp:Transcript_122805/g.358421  ORF Transcript_122805/g.358421 Transcript_122805/m.358421 type:complete len:253 (-) Transcript_122805:12-770(-)
MPGSLDAMPRPPLLLPLLALRALPAGALSGRAAIAPQGLVGDWVRENFWRPVEKHSLRTKHASSSSTRAGARSSVCSIYPVACREPFSCGQPKEEKAERKRMYSQIALQDGHANLQAWCSSVFRTDYVEYVDQCLRGNMQASADIVYDMQRKLSPDGSLLKADAEYCVAAGHCENTDVSENTTLTDAELMCDRKYTRSAWTTLGIQDLVSAPRTMTPETAPVWGQLACAMGNFHCDVMYCRLKHCGRPVKLA